MTKTITKNATLDVDGIRFSYDVVKVDNGYTYDLRIGSSLSYVHAGRGFFAKAEGETVGAQARRVVEAAALVAIARSRQFALYVVIDDMPGFADESLGDVVQAAYRGPRDGHGPRYVVRVDGFPESAEIVDRVKAIGTIVDGGRTFTPKVTRITTSALDACEGSPWMASEAVTYVAATRAHALIDA